MSLSDIRKKLDKKEISAQELCLCFFDRIEKYDKKINSFITVCPETALSQATAAQKMIDRGEHNPLCGIPVSIKDNICTKGIKTTCASKMLEDFYPVYDAAVVRKLKNEGAVILGKTNMDEFSMGSTTETSYFGAVKNPYDLARVSGGSSGGAAAGVCAEFSAAAIGSDTGGSVRQPASFCGVTGLKPTYGTVSRYGLIAFASSFDQIGVIAHSAEDAGFVLKSIAGKDEMDATTKKVNIDYISGIGRNLKGLKIGIPREFFERTLPLEIKAAVFAAIEYYKKSGCEIAAVSLPSLEYAVSAYYVLSSAEAASNLSRYDGIKYGYRADEESYSELLKSSRSESFGSEVKRRIMLGNYALSSGYYDDYYKNACTIQKKIKLEFDEIFENCDIIITPTVPTTALKIGERENNPVEMYKDDKYTVAVNIAGLPAISTPCGYGEGGLPIGMSIVGRAFEEDLIIAVADRFERDFKRQEAWF